MNPFNLHDVWTTSWIGISYTLEVQVDYLLNGVSVTTSVLERVYFINNCRGLSFHIMLFDFQGISMYFFEHLSSLFIVPLLKATVTGTRVRPCFFNDGLGLIDVNDTKVYKLYPKTHWMLV